MNCGFRFASFFASNFVECKMTGSDFGDASIDCMNIKGGDWSYTCLKELDFSKMELSGISFEGADLSRCKLEKCLIDGCRFYGANLQGVSFRGSDLRGSDLTGIEVLEADFKNTKVDLEQCVVIASALGAEYVPDGR